MTRRGNQSQSPQSFAQLQAFLYGRVSTQHQRDTVSLPAQFARAEEWTLQQSQSQQSHQYIVAGRYSDPAVSGKSMRNRPGLLAALEACVEAGAAGVLVVWSFSRLARNVDELLSIAARLRKAGAGLVSVTQNFDTTTAMGRYAFIMWAALDELVPNLTGEHVSSVLQYKKEQGLKYGEVPYGKKLQLQEQSQSSTSGQQLQQCPHDTDRDKACVCRLVDDAEEIEVLKLMWELKRRLRKWSSVALALNERGVKTKKGRQWSAQNLRKIAISVIR